MTRILSRLALRMTLWCVAAALLVGAAGFLMAALWLALLERLSPTVAALATGVAGLIAAGIIILVARGGAKSRAPRQGREAEAAAMLGATLGREAAAQIAAHPARGTAIAAVLGFIVGTSPRLRQALRALLH